MSVGTPVPKVHELFSADAVTRRVAELAREIRADAGDVPLTLLGVLKGTSCFTADLLRAIPGDVGYGFIEVVRDVSDTEIASAIEINFIRTTSIHGRDVLLLKDVVSTGVIESYLLSQLRLHAPRSLRLVALLDRPSMRTVDLAVDYRAFEAGAGSFVGYGLEFDGRHANSGAIGRL